VEARHELVGGILNPAFLCIGNDDDFGLFETVLQKLDGLVFYFSQELLVLLSEEVVLVFVDWVKVRSREKGVVPIKNDQVFVGLWLLHWWQPNLLLGKSGEEL
jgi:hypothetical protein